MKKQTIPRKLQRRVEKRLEHDEQIEWIGMPSPHFFPRDAVKACLAGLAFAAFGVFFIVGYLEQRGFEFIPITFAAAFVVAGVLLLLAPVWSYLNALKSVYAITNKRAITIIVGGGGRFTGFYSPADLQNILCKVNEDGTGDVIVPYPASVDSRNSDLEEFGFLRIRNVEKVKRILTKLTGQAVSR